MVANSPESLARALVERLGGRYSTELGIETDVGNREVERWALAATLFGARISAGIAARSFRTLAQAGVETLADAGGRSWSELVTLLDEGGYVRYDFRTATKLHRLAEAIERDHDGRLARVLEIDDAAQLEATLRRLPGWGPVTVQLFLRELRGASPGAEPALDRRAHGAAQHLGLVRAGRVDRALAVLRRVAGRASIDLRDLEAALVRLSLRHARTFGHCPGGPGCRYLCGSQHVGPAD